jgi:hypothetical protein
MILISHRGNYKGSNPKNENAPSQIDRVLSLGFDCEIDVWMINDQFFLGHDCPHYRIDISFLYLRLNHLFLHAKNIEVLNELSKSKTFHFFAHANDPFVVTSQGIIWCYPSKKPFKCGINLFPEKNNLSKNDLKDVYGICSDYIELYR